MLVVVEVEVDVEIVVVVAAAVVNAKHIGQMTQQWRGMECVY